MLLILSNNFTQSRGPTTWWDVQQIGRVCQLEDNTCDHANVSWDKTTQHTNKSASHGGELGRLLNHRSLFGEHWLEDVRQVYLCFREFCQLQSLQSRYSFADRWKNFRSISVELVRLPGWCSWKLLWAAGCLFSTHPLGVQSRDAALVVFRTSMPQTTGAYEELCFLLVYCWFVAALLLLPLFNMGAGGVWCWVVLLQIRLGCGFSLVKCKLGCFLAVQVRSVDCWCEYTKYLGCCCCEFGCWQYGNMATMDDSL